MFCFQELRTHYCKAWLIITDVFQVTVIFCLSLLRETLCSSHPVITQLAPVHSYSFCPKQIEEDYPSPNHSRICFPICGTSGSHNPSWLPTLLQFFKFPSIPVGIAKTYIHTYTGIEKNRRKLKAVILEVFNLIRCTIMNIIRKK